MQKIFEEHNVKYKVNSPDYFLTNTGLDRVLSKSAYLMLKVLWRYADYDTLLVGKYVDRKTGQAKNPGFRDTMLEKEGIKSISKCRRELIAFGLLKIAERRPCNVYIYQLLIPDYKLTQAGKNLLSIATFKDILVDLAVKGNITVSQKEKFFAIKDKIINYLGEDIYVKLSEIILNTANNILFFNSKKFSFPVMKIFHHISINNKSNISNNYNIESTDTNNKSNVSVKVIKTTNKDCVLKQRKAISTSLDENSFFSIIGDESLVEQPTLANKPNLDTISTDTAISAGHGETITQENKNKLVKIDKNTSKEITVNKDTREIILNSFNFLTAKGVKLNLVVFTNYVAQLWPWVEEIAQGTDIACEIIYNLAINEFVANNAYSPKYLGAIIKKWQEGQAVTLSGGIVLPFSGVKQSYFSEFDYLLEKSQQQIHRNKGERITVSNASNTIVTCNADIYRLVEEKYKFAANWFNRKLNNYEFYKTNKNGYVILLVDENWSDKQKHNAVLLAGLVQYLTKTVVLLTTQLPTIKHQDFSSHQQKHQDFYAAENFGFVETIYDLIIEQNKENIEDILDYDNYKINSLKEKIQNPVVRILLKHQFAGIGVRKEFIKDFVIELNYLNLPELVVLVENEFIVHWINRNLQKIDISELIGENIPIYAKVTIDIDKNNTITELATDIN